MKRVLLLSALFLSTVFIQKANAQVSFSVNIGTQPVWGPTGYDHVEYYYLPDIDAYYYVPQRVFYYQDRGRWISSASLPPRYRNFDLYSGYKVVVNEPRPYLRNNIYRTKYASYRGRRGQEIIRNSRDVKYYANPYHPQHTVWIKKYHTNGTPVYVPKRVNDRPRNHGNVKYHTNGTRAYPHSRTRVIHKEEHRDHH